MNETFWYNLATTVEQWSFLYFTKLINFSLSIYTTADSLPLSLLLTSTTGYQHRNSTPVGATYKLSYLSPHCIWVELGHHHQSLNREGRWSTKDDFATSFLHFSLFSTAFWDLPNSRPVHSLMLSSHLFLCPPCLLSPFIVPCKMVLARPDEREAWPNYCSLRLFTIIRSSCGPIACWILARTSSLVTWSLYEMCSILR